MHTKIEKFIDSYSSFSSIDKFAFLSNDSVQCASHSSEVLDIGSNESILFY